MRKRGISSIARLRWLLGLLFLGLAVPAALLVRQGFVQLELEEFRRQQLIAEQVVRSVDAALQAAIAAENARPVTDFEVAAPVAGSDAVQLSPLASVAAAGAFPGTIGYFQVDAAGQLSTPLLPEPEQDRRALDDADFQSKIAVEQQLSEVLEANRLVDETRADSEAERQRAANEADTPAPGANRPTAAEIRGQRAFDVLVSSSAAPPAREEAVRQNSVGDSEASAEAFEDADALSFDAPAAPSSALAVPIATFSGEVEPLRFSLLETGHFVLFRNAFRDGERYVQGMLIEPEQFISASVEPALTAASLAAGTRLTIAAFGSEVATLTTGGGAAGGPVVTGPAVAAVAGMALYQARLSPPLADLELAFAAGVLDRGPASNLLVWTAIALATVLVGGAVYLLVMLAFERRFDIGLREFAGQVRGSF